MTGKMEPPTTPAPRLHSPVVPTVLKCHPAREAHRRCIHDASGYSRLLCWDHVAAASPDDRQTGAPAVGEGVGNTHALSEEEGTDAFHSASLGH